MRRAPLRLCAIALCLLSLPVLAGKPAAKTASECWLPAFKAADADAATACYADDAVLWIPGAPTARGSKAIHDAYAGFFAASTIKEVTLTESGASEMGDMRAAWGTFRIVAVAKADGSESVETGRYTDVQKKIGGRWVYVVDHASDEPAPPAAPAAP